MAGQKKSKNIKPAEIPKRHLSSHVKNLSTPSHEDIQSLVKELEFHQSELERQVATFQDTQDYLLKSRDECLELYNTAPVGYLTIDNDLTVLETNPAAAKMLGVNRSYILKSKFTRFIAPTPEAQDTFHFHMLKAQRTGGGECDLEMQRFNGERFSALVQTTRVVEEVSGNQRYHISVMDITERKKIEQALKESEDKFERTFHMSPVAMSLGQIPDFRFVDVNDGFLRLFEYDRDKVVGHETEELNLFVNPRPRSQVNKFFAEDGRVHNVELMMRARTGKTLNIMLSTEKISLNGRVHLISTYVDMTERKQAEAALQESERKYRTIVETANEGIVISEPEGNLLYVNQRMADLLGYSIDEILSKNTLDLLFDDYKPRGTQARKILHKGDHAQGEFKLRRRDGSPVWTSYNATPMFNDREEHIANFAMHTDITERKKAEAELARTRDELEIKVKERTQKLAEANEQLKEFGHRITRVQEEERKRIAFELHDDTAQYLSILKLQLDALIKSGKIKDPEILAKLQYLEKDADRAFNDVRRYSHELRPSVLEHLGLLAAVEQITEDINKLDQFKVEIEVEGREPKLTEEVKLGLFRITQEAINNVRKHASASKAIVHIKFQPRRISLVVIDNGVGFDMRDARTRSVLKGSLGMMSMQERADLIGAKLKIESKPGQGTIVRVEMAL